MNSNCTIMVNAIEPREYDRAGDERAPSIAINCNCTVFQTSNSEHQPSMVPKTKVLGWFRAVPECCCTKLPLELSILWLGRESSRTRKTKLAGP